MEQTERISPDIAGMLTEKAGLKQDVYAKTLEVFALLSTEAEKLMETLSKDVAAKDSRIRMIFSRQSEFEFQIHIGGDVLVFLMHTNVFLIDPDHKLWKSAYIKKENSRAFVGMINVYNFLHDSLHYNRDSDLGYLVGRAMVNTEGHYFVEMQEGARNRHQDFKTKILDTECAKCIIEDLMELVIDFDMYVPPIAEVTQFTVNDMNQAVLSQKFKTGKRLGFSYGNHQ
ncbi:MAG: hypothetical protein V4616_13255 [Bacteroidota bacterium]